MHGFRLIYLGRGSIRLVIALSLATMILVSIKFAGKSYSITVGRGLLGLPLPTSSGSGEEEPRTHIEPSWLEGKSEEGFLLVENILRDPKTTEDSVQLDSIGHTSKPSSDGDINKLTGDKKPKRKLSRPKVKSDLEAAAEDNHNSDFDSVMNYNSHFTPHITKDIYKEGYAIANREACDRHHEPSNPLVTILVISAPDHFKQREAIRSTWGRSNDREVVFSFLVGLSDNLTVSRAVTDESDANGDVIVNNIEDLYQNLSLKTLSAFNWLRQFCQTSSFLLKVDDDMFVQVERLLELIKTLMQDSGGENPKLIVGNISRGWKPVRNPKSKYLITEEQYPGQNYPGFATGPSYLVSRQAVMDIISVALEENYIHLEDVFLTGVVAEQLGIPRINYPQ